MITRVDLGDGVGAAFTGRRGGLSAAPYDSLNLGGAVGDDAETVYANRRRAEAELGLPRERTAWMRQVHGTTVTYVDLARADRPETDAMLTDATELALAVLVADCAPVLLADPAARVVAVAHSGRAGTAAGVVPAAVAAMARHGADPARTRAAIGPAVCGACYEVPGPLRDEVAAAVPEAYATTRAGTPGLDIRAGVVAQLKAAGVAEVQVDERCTVETPGLFSYRRDGRTGRFAGYVWLRGPERP